MKKKSELKKYLIVLLVILLALGLFGASFWKFYKERKAAQSSQSVDTSKYYNPPVPEVQSENDQEQKSENAPEIVSNDLPENALIKMDFTSQAPLVVWDALHEDACEEASFLMVKHYLEKKSIGSAEEMDSELNQMVSWENANGYGGSITAEQLVSIAKDKYGMMGEVKTATLEDIKREIAAGRPVIVPAAGKLLGNPNFRGGGPNYHMLVIIGYDNTHFITNDPGTRNGKSYVYSQDVLMNAIHNWDPNNILNGGKEYVVFAN